MRRHAEWLILPLTLTLILSLVLAPVLRGRAEHVHAWSDWAADPSAPAGCTSGGREMRTCGAEGCPAPTEFRPTAALGHDWGDWQAAQAAGCVREGLNRRSCRRCDAQESMKTPSLGGHRFGEWTGFAAAACLKGGTNRRTCSVCQESEYQSTPALGHDWEHRVTAAGCTGVGVEEDVCRRCGQRKNTVVTAALGHDWGTFTETLAPACAAAGSERALCRRCGIQWTRAVPALGHSWGPYAQKTAAGCTTPGLETRACARCGIEQLRALAALGHSWGAEVIGPAPTCQAEGLSVRACARCGESLSAVLPKTDHAYGAWSVAVAPGCTERGTELRACAVCGRQQTRRLKALGHVSDGVWVTVREPSLSQRGLQATGCTRCGGRAETRTLSPRGYRYEISAWAFGPEARQLDSALSGVSERLIPVDLSAPSRRSVPLVTEDGYLIGAALIEGEPGMLSVSLEKASEPTLMRYKRLRVYAGPEEAAFAAGGEGSLPFGQPFRVAGDKALVSISFLANYYQGNENRPFHPDLMMPDGSGSYGELAQRMAEEIARLWAAR